MRFRLKGIFPFLCVVLLMMASCSDNSIDKNIDAAENALANNDVVLAQKICNSIAEKDSLNDLSTTQLCRLSILFIELAERGDDGSNVGVAANCYHRAISQHRDSALSYYQSLPEDRMNLVHLLWVLDRPRNSETDGDKDIDSNVEESDSLVSPYMDNLYMDSINAKLMDD